MRITLLGPSFPYRGGISQYNTFLYRALRKKYDVQFIGFSRQYPKLLFPGDSDREYNEHLYEPEIHHIIDSINPLTWIKAVRKIRKYNPDIVIIPWWVFFFAPCFWFISKFSKFKRDTVVMMLCHNVIEHETNILKKKISKLVFRTADFFLVHSNVDRDNLNSMLPDKFIIKSFLPTFEDLIVEQNNINLSLDKKRELDLIGKKVLLFFGFVRPYKGLKNLLLALEKLSKKYQDIHLLVVGEFQGDKIFYLDQIKSLGIQNNVTIIDSYVPSEEVPNYFNISNLTVLPYISATQSAVVQLSYGFNKPVLVTDVGGLSEAVINGETGYIVDSQNIEQIVNSISDYFDNNREEEMVRNVSRYKYNFSWEEFINKLELEFENYINKR